LTIIEWADQVFPETADPDCAAIVQKEIESYGTSIHLGERVKEIKQRGNKTVVISGLGEELSADMVITGIGVTPNVQLISDSGIEVNRGIVVDGMMRTNISNVFAAGDVSEGENLATGKNEILPNWSNACKQGRIAGLNMAGYEQRYEGGLRETITSIFGLVLVAIGLVHAPKNNVVEEISFVELQRKTYRKVLVAGDRMVGAVLLGKIEDAGIIKNFIRNKKKVSCWKEGIARSPLDMRKVLLSITGECDTYRFK
jgi:NADPH-dependent 2,4-dienoyl-CoA reductase/sulfur reductase-like enzyme